MKYSVFLEKGASSYGAFVPDIPGCIAVGKSRNEVLILIKEAIEFHLEGIKIDNDEIPLPKCEVAQVDVNYNCADFLQHTLQ